MEIPEEAKAVLEKFLNCCRSAKNRKIIFEGHAQKTSRDQFYLYTDESRIKFILDSISIYDFDDKREYRLKPGNIVFSYHFFTQKRN